MTAYKYQALLASLLLVVVAYPALRGPGGSPGLAWAVRVAVIVAGIVVVFGDHPLRRWTALFLLPVVAAGGLRVFAPQVPAATAAEHLIVAVFHLGISVVLARGVYRERTINSDAVAAALCGYLLLGMAFGHVYAALAAAAPGSFAGFDPDLDPDERHVLLTYFSFATLTTVGYGDITPARDTSRAIAVVEAVMGQFYLAVLVADLVGKRLAAPPPPA